ncbi:hypothetical protein RJT34_12213 [Clitoria ternatea]|uniref:Uncharacterized protein n=1 Tax=Clitoria ternatea TaxID=43366 RepID=A0AAN9JLB9_CLITE
MPTSSAVSCSSMRGESSNLLLGNVTVQQTSSGCNVASCNYSCFVNGTIITNYDDIEDRSIMVNCGQMRLLGCEWLKNLDVAAIITVVPDSSASMSGLRGKDNRPEGNEGWSGSGMVTYNGRLDDGDENLK